MAEQAALSFGGLLRQLRAEARLTQEELAEAAQLSPRSVSDLERGINRTARKDTAELLADALDLAGPTRELFVAAARGRGPAEDVLDAREGRTPGAGQRVARWVRACPYRGLLPFGEADAEVFYGRERLAAELAAKLAARAVGGGMMVVTGPSGSGKSSLLRAGLLPILARGQQLPGSDRWPRIVMTPTKDPLTELAARLAAVGGPDALAVRDGLARHPDQAHLAIRSAVLAAAARRDEQLPAPGDGVARLVLLVDQFEQVFTLNTDSDGEATRQAFITALCSAAASPAGPGQVPPALVVIAVRGDFWDRCAAVPELVGPLQDGQFIVGPMTESELRVAITGPAQAAGLRIDTALTDTILGDLRVAGGDRSAGVLPLLSQAMTLTWEQREGDRLTSRGYALAGGVSHAVQTGADRVYDALPAGQQAIARSVLRSMTVASRDGGLARRPVTRDDLYTGLPGAARADVDAVLDAFAAERLAVLDEDTAQISHDVVLRAWPRLRAWLEEDQASWILYSQLADAAAGWQDSHDDPSFLYRGTQLAVLQQAVVRWSANPARSPALTSVHRAFLRASEQAAARSTRRRRSALAILALLTALAVVAAGFAFSQRAAAVRQRDQVIYNQVLAEALQFGTSNPSLAAQLTLAAYRLRRSQDLLSRLLNTENTPLSSPLAVGSGEVLSVAFSPGRHTLASGDDSGTIRLWDVSDPAHPRPLGRPLTGIGDAVFSVAFSADGHTLASGSFDGTIRLWDVTDPAHPRPLGQSVAGNGGSPTSAVDSVAFNADESTLASGNADGTIRLWDVTDPARIRLLSQLGQPHIASAEIHPYPLAFSPDGHTLASIENDGTIRLWDVTDPAHPRPLGQSLTGTGSPLDSVAYSPDGHVLASGSVDGTTRLWDLTDPAHPRPLGQFQADNSNVVDSVAFSPDGHVLASASFDGTIRLWDVSDPAHPRPLGQPLTGTGNAVDSVAFSPDGHTLASGDLGGTIQLWNLPSTVLTGSGSPVDSVAYSRDGHTLASGSFDGTIRLWDITDSAHPRLLGQPLTGTGYSLDSVAYSPDGHTLASGSFDGTIRLWDITDPAHPRLLGQPLTGTGNVSISVVFSPDGHTLASWSSDGTIQLWDVTDPAHPQRPSQLSQAGNGIPVEVAFGPHGRMLASGNGDGTIQLWDVTDPVHPQPLRQLGQPRAEAANGSVASVTFSPDGHTLASGDAGGAIRLWDITNTANPQPLARLQTGGSAPVASVAFSPRAHTLASGNGDGTIQFWDVTDPAHPQPLGQPLTDTGSPLATVAFSPDGHTLATGGPDNTTRLWNLNVRYAIERICATTKELTPQQWNQYIPQLQYKPPCAH